MGSHSGNLKSLLLKLLLVPGATAPFTPLVRQKAVIFMLHRFRSPAVDLDDVDPTGLRKCLAYLRKKRYNLVSLEALFRSLTDGTPIEKSVAFTIDDGYREQATVATEIFQEFDCPATTFLATGFVDGSLWFWWDQIEYIFSHSKSHELVANLGELELKYQWEDQEGRSRAQMDFTMVCKTVPDQTKLKGIRTLAERAGVDLPTQPPAEYAPMTWDEARACEKQCMAFGPHTVTHPILSQTADEQSTWEISHSWERVHAEMRRPVPIFCYPNGQWTDFGPRELTNMRAAGMIGAVVGVPGYAEAPNFRSSPDTPFKVRRFGYQNSLPHIIQCVSGFERLKQLLRREEL
ncbi:MAG TPA: polysaccharide deacetylase family protein [Terriglobia bacterium]|nr:polysaccharide deacetylase family protein [Terriglobia bacterium]